VRLPDHPIGRPGLQVSGSLDTQGKRERRNAPVIEFSHRGNASHSSDKEHCADKYERCTDHKGIERLRKSHGGPPSRLPANDRHGFGAVERKIVAALQLRMKKTNIDRIPSSEKIEILAI
jgi:hypothetical protein